MKSHSLSILLAVVFSISFSVMNNNQVEASDIESKNTTHRMNVYHRDGTIHFEGKETGVSPTRPAKFTLTRGTAVDVWIMDNNPFLFTYQDKVETKETEDYAALKVFLTTLEGVLREKMPEVTENKSRYIARETTVEPPTTIKEILKAIKGDITEINNNLRDRKSIITQTTGSASDVRTAKETVADWKLSELNSRLRNNYKELKKLIEESNSNSTDEILQKKVENILRQLDWGDLPKIKETLKHVTNSNIDNLLGSLEEYKFELSKPNNNSPLNPSEYIHLGLLALIHEKDTLKALSDLHEFERVLNQVHSGKKLDVVETKDSRMRREMTISVTRNTTYRDADLLSPTAMKAQDAGVGKFQLHFERKSYVRYTISPGVVYSFVEDPDYTVHEDDKGNRTVSQTSDDYKAVSGAVMLNIIPEKMFETNFEPFLQLGASADSNNIGLLLGAGFSVFAFPDDNAVTQRTLTVSGGVIWQEVKKLQDGLSVGDPLEKDADLITEEEMEAGFYLMLGVNF